MSIQMTWEPTTFYRLCVYCLV